LLEVSVQSAAAENPTQQELTLGTTLFHHGGSREKAFKKFKNFALRI
jgi:hypothetical protein